MVQSNNENAKPQIAVIGGGSWATALIKILSEQSVRIRWWLRSKADVEYIKEHRSNPRYLSDIAIHNSRVRPTYNLKKALDGADIVLLVTPGAFVQEVLDEIPAELLAGKIILSAIKGMIPSAHLPVTDWLVIHKGIQKSHLAIVSGPCHAEEVALERLSYLTIAGENEAVTKKLAAMLQCRYIHTTVSQDLDGVEYAAILKNVIALTCGIAHGLNNGDNFQAVLVSNATQEIARFLTKAFPGEHEINSSAILGDLLVTAYSQFSRNRTFGNMIGRGYSVQSAQVEMNMIAEGYYAVNSMHQLNHERWQIPMPILETAYSILYEKVPASQAIERLKMQLK
jgi:glycerol-3-phosphate dehydrogenase (NAD(P)+)